MHLIWARKCKKKKPTVISSIKGLAYNANCLTYFGSAPPDDFQDWNDRTFISWWCARDVPLTSRKTVSESWQTKFGKSRSAWLGHFSLYMQSTAFLCIQVISDVWVGLPPKVIWWTAREKLLRHDRVFCVVGDTQEDSVNPTNRLYQWEQRVTRSQTALVPRVQQ